MKRIAFVLYLVFAFMFGACSTIGADADQTRPLKIWGHNTVGAYNTLCVVDDDTGVNYIVVSTEWGNGEYSIAITPRLNGDGSLYVS